MKKISKFILVVLPLAIVFSSCVDITRNIVINKDGSGTEQMQVNISRQFFSMMQGLAALDTTKKQKDFFDDSEIIADIRENLEESGASSRVSIESVLNSDSSKTLTIGYDFNNLAAITMALDAEAPAENRGDIYMKEQDGNMKFYYELPADNNGNQDTTNAEFTKKMFEGKNFTVNIEFPYDVISSNATSSNGRKLTWVFPMNSFSTLGEKRILTAELSK